MKKTKTELTGDFFIFSISAAQQTETSLGDFFQILISFLVFLGWILIKSCLFLFFDKICKKWMVPAYRAGQELSENCRNINFWLIFDMFMIKILFYIWGKNNVKMIYVD